MTEITITAGPYVFGARLETEAAPLTCKAFAAVMPFESQLVHVRWSGEGVWVPLGDRDFGIGYGNSSGYGCEEHYVHPWGPERFRCV